MRYLSRKGHTYRIVVSDLMRRQADMVRRSGSLRAEHGYVLQMVGDPRRQTGIQAGSHGHVACLRELYRQERTPGRPSFMTSFTS